MDDTRIRVRVEAQIRVWVKGRVTRKHKYMTNK